MAELPLHVRSLLVLPETTLDCKSAVAYITRERLIPGVGSLVPREKVGKLGMDPGPDFPRKNIATGNREQTVLNVTIYLTRRPCKIFPVSNEWFLRTSSAKLASL